MPELPDIEVFRRYLDSTGLHQRIEEVEVRSSKVLEGVSSKRLQKELEGTLLSSTQRHGKYLFVHRSRSLGDEAHSGRTAPPLLVLHFGMTGYLKYFKERGGASAEAAESRPDLQRELRHERLALRFENGYHLAYVNQRLLGSVFLADDVERFIQDKQLGPDALALEAGELAERIRRGRGSLKSTLMNQKLLAGVGNVYSDEILFHARLHPRAKVQELDDGTMRELHGMLRYVLNEAIEAGADPGRMPSSWLLPHREEGAPCPRCSGSVAKETVSGRSAYFCPKCQRGGNS
jgi:formamidopyrimidine-DNA glycosylase